MRVKFSELGMGDRFTYIGIMWTKTDWDNARKHSDASLGLSGRGYGYHDTICHFEDGVMVDFQPPAPVSGIESIEHDLAVLAEKVKAYRAQRLPEIQAVDVAEHEDNFKKAAYAILSKLQDVSYVIGDIKEINDETKTER